MLVSCLLRWFSFTPADRRADPARAYSQVRERGLHSGAGRPARTRIQGLRTRALGAYFPSPAPLPLPIPPIARCIPAAKPRTSPPSRPSPTVVIAAQIASHHSYDVWIGVLTASCYICRTSARSRRNGRPQTISCSGCRSAVDETQRARLPARRASCATSASLGLRDSPSLLRPRPPVHPSSSLPLPNAATPRHATPTAPAR